MHLPRSSSVSVISAEHLHKELFTHRSLFLIFSGAGSLIRRGYRISKHTDTSKLDMDRIRHLLEEHDPQVLNSSVTVASILQSLQEKKFTCYVDAACNNRVD